MPMQRRIALASAIAAATSAAGVAPAAIACTQGGRGGSCTQLSRDQALLQVHRSQPAAAGASATTAAEPKTHHLYKERSLVADEGVGVRDEFEVESATQCAALCDGVDACRSFAYSDFQKACHMKNREVQEDDPMQEPGKWHYRTYMRVGPHAQAAVMRFPSWDPLPEGGVEARSYVERSLVADEGHELFAALETSIEGCENLCDRTKGCQSFAFSVLQRSCHLKDKLVTKDDQEAEPYLDFKTYYLDSKAFKAIADCSQHIDGGDWTIVRHTKGSGTWGAWNDNLAGTAEQGEPGDGMAPYDWTVPWASTPKQFLFAFADCSRWLIVEPGQVIGGNYANSPRWIVKSSEHKEPYQAKWYNRARNKEDPWVSERDHWLSGKYGSGAMLYGEAGNSGHAAMKNSHGGANVYIRGFVHWSANCSADIDGGGWTLVRHNKGSGNWGSWNDNLAGTAEQGEAADSLAAHDWTVPWKVEPEQQFLFAFADCSHWLIAEPAQVIGENFANSPRWIVKSSEHEEPYQAKWYNRARNKEDPWVSERDHWLSGDYDSGAMLYGEAGHSRHAAMKNSHGGANVYIRSARPAQR